MVKSEEARMQPLLRDDEEVVSRENPTQLEQSASTTSLKVYLLDFQRDCYRLIPQLYFFKGSSELSTPPAPPEGRGVAGDGPVIIPLETDREDESVIHHYSPEVEAAAWFLHQYVRFHFLILLPLVVLAANYLCYEDVHTIGYVAWIAHLILLWVARFVFPLEDLHCKYAGMAISDLWGTCATIVFGFLLSSINRCYFVQEDFVRLRMRFVCLALSLKLRSTLFQNRRYLLVYAVTSLLTAEMLLPGFVIFTLLPCLITPLWNLVYLALMILCPCLPVRAIKVMELEEAELYESLEEEEQAKVEQQILQLGRPMSTSSTFLERGQRTFAKTAAFLALWVLVIWGIQQSLVMSTQWETVYFKIKTRAGD